MRKLLPLALLAWLGFAAVAHADPVQGRSLVSSNVASTTDGNLVCFNGPGGKRVKDCGVASASGVTASSVFGTDNVVIRSDGTGRGTQLTAVTIDDSNLVGLGTAVPTHTLTLGSTATGIALYNTSDQVTNYERGLLSWSSNALTLSALKAGSGTNRSIVLNAANAATVTLGSGGVLTLAPGIGATTNAASLDVTNGGVSWSATSTSQYHLRLQGTVNQASGTASWAGIFGNWTFTACGSGGCKMLELQSASTAMFSVNTLGSPDHNSTVTTAGTTGNQTINKPCGTANIAATGTAVTVTNSEVTASTIMSVMARTNDTTCRVANYVPGSGTVTINMTAACAAETSVGFCIVDKN